MVDIFESQILTQILGMKLTEEFNALIRYYNCGVLMKCKEWITKGNQKEYSEINLNEANQCKIHPNHVKIR